ncbi:MULTISPECIES: hypothetical protein [unclassified Bradyrhizobium]|uniref:hypothetical protein n=1 Tax=unclassified Bradyrhizobium TaxID=2631580 RepID=UPI001043BEFD|nr:MULTISPECIES: hypothetical protein [unclassified Bradyrhizobium]
MTQIMSHGSSQNMHQYPEFAIRPPETIEAKFEKAIQGPLWDHNQVWALSMLRFCTDEECAALSGVPERSLRLLQTAGVLYATKAPRAGGSFKRVWHLPEAAVAAALECLKRATNVDYATIAEISRDASDTLRKLFVNFTEMSEDDIREEFGAMLILSEGNAFHVQINKAVMGIDPALRDLWVGNVIPVSANQNGTWKAISRKNIDQRERFSSEFETARFHSVVNLKNVFTQFERDARKMRT